jgi:hypothetical protein
MTSLHEKEIDSLGRSVERFIIGVAADSVNKSAGTIQGNVMFPVNSVFVQDFRNAVAYRVKRCEESNFLRGCSFFDLTAVIW